MNLCKLRLIMLTRTIFKKIPFFFKPLYILGKEFTAIFIHITQCSKNGTEEKSSFPGKFSKKH